MQRIVHSSASNAASNSKFTSSTERLPIATTSHVQTEQCTSERQTSFEEIPCIPHMCVCVNAYNFKAKIAYMIISITISCREEQASFW